MLTKRQIDLLSLFLKNPNQPLPIEELIVLFSVGKRSISNDINALNNYLSDFNELSIIKMDSRTYIFNSTDKNSIHLIKNELRKLQHQLQFDSSIFRTQFILFKLVNSKKWIKSTDLSQEMFISETRISQDLKIVRKLLKKYDLQLRSKPYYGIKLFGSEADKRKLIVNENIIELPLSTPKIIDNKTNFISKTLAKLLLKFHFRVSDLVFQNLITHIYNSIVRIKNGYFLEETSDLEPVYSHSYEIAKCIFVELEGHYQFTCPQEEIKNLAINLQTKREYDEFDYINKEMSQIVSENLTTIENKFGIDFSDDVDLRISLALHTKSLITRMVAKRQLNNVMTYEIKQKNGYAFDIASEYGYQLSQKYQVKLSDDEIAYLSLYFIRSLQTILENKTDKKVLLVSAQRKSNTILIRMQLQQWYNESLSIDCINIFEYTDEVENEYSIILTTEKEFVEKHRQAVLIDLFPTDKDHQRIDLALNGLSETDTILNFFDSRLFFYGEVADKESMLRKLCEKIESLHPTDNQLLSSVLNHENKVESYFGNQFAMPHPDSPLTEESYICVGIPEKPLKWGDKEGIKVVFLICIGKEKSNEDVLQIWQYLSYLIQDPQQVDKILQKLTYTNFIDLITEFYRKILRDEDKMGYLPSK